MDLGVGTNLLLGDVVISGLVIVRPVNVDLYFWIQINISKRIYGAAHLNLDNAHITKKMDLGAALMQHF